jgi:hypothetical protein
LYLHGKSRNRLAAELSELELTLLAVKSPKEGIRSGDSTDDAIHEDQQLVLFGPDIGHETLGGDVCRGLA